MNDNSWSKADDYEWLKQQQIVMFLPQKQNENVARKRGLIYDESDDLSKSEREMWWKTSNDIRCRVSTKWINDHAHLIRQQWWYCFYLDEINYQTLDEMKCCMLDWNGIILLALLPLIKIKSIYTPNVNINNFSYATKKWKQNKIKTRDTFVQGHRSISQKSRK